ncbi:MAG: 7TM-DISM domain-containing protein [Leptospiraceae bacterium]|nr:7TM-DISM domain-containing protein [Leptospiraceae bacterium]
MKAIKLSIQIICLLSLLFILLGCVDKSSQVQMKATKGELDLSQWDFDKDGTVTLEGEWDFYWNQFLSYEEIIAKKSSIDTYLKVPGVWKDLKVGNSVLPGDGYITIHLLVKLPKAFENLAIKIPEIGTAYKIWINETLIHEGGKIGNTREAMTAFVIPEVVSLNLSKEKEIHITIQISNFMDRTGGVWGDFSFGNANEIYRITNIIFSLETMVFGGLFIMSVYHFGLFLIRTQDKSTLFFGLFCLDFAIRTLIVGQKILIYTFPFLPFEITFRIDYLTAYLAFPFFISFLYYLFKEETNRNYIRITWICFFFLCLTVIILPHFEYTQFLIPYELYVLFSILILFM